MELKFEEPSLFIMRAFGVVTVDEVRLAINGLLADSRLCDGVALFIDNREVTSTRSVGEVAVITSGFSKVFARVAMRVAVVTDGELEASQVFASFASTVNADVRVFRNEKTALEWLSGSSSKPTSS